MAECFGIRVSFAAVEASLLTQFEPFVKGQEVVDLSNLAPTFEVAPCLFV